MAASVYSRTLQKAAELIGGRGKLARLLRVPIKDLEAWIADEAKPPLNVFLRAVDMIVDEGGTTAAGEPGDAQPPRDAAGGSRAQYDD